MTTTKSWAMRWVKMREQALIAAESTICVQFVLGALHVCGVYEEYGD